MQQQATLRWLKFASLSVIGFGLLGGAGHRSGPVRHNQVFH